MLAAAGFQQARAGANPNELPVVALYEQLRSFRLSGDTVHADHLSMKRDRVAVEWTGDFYLSTAVEGNVRGMVFIGHGHLTVEPMNSFERGNIHRFLKSDVVDATFTTAVLRFTDDTYDELAKLPRGRQPDFASAQRLASDLENHLVRETGLNLSARLAAAIANSDKPGVFFGEFNGGNHGRFAALIDYQMRSIASTFQIDGGEKGIVFQYQSEMSGVDIWTAFYSEQEISGGRVLYSNSSDLVNIPDYRMEIDLRDAGHWLRATFEVALVSLRDGLQIIPLSLNEGLGEYGNVRLKNGVRILSATMSDGTPAGVIQDPWEKGVSLVIPHPLTKDQKITVTFKAEAEHAFTTWSGAFHYPLSTESWYPRHGALQRSRFDIRFLHKEKTRVISVGQRVQEELAGKEMFTEWKTEEPIVLACFAVGPFERHGSDVTVEDHKIPVEFYSVPSSYGAIKEDFVVAELANGVTFFSQLFGNYPYQRLGSVYFPLNFGQGFPTMLLLPVSGSSRLRDFSFIAHEISHEWWGDLVAWRSYRDQWLSEGFAEYSAALYASRRDNPKRALDLVKDMRQRLQYPPGTETGLASGTKLYQVGSLITGLRSSSNRSRGAYTALIYYKGALTLRMLHFLFSDPASGDDRPFYQLMKEFVQKNRNGWASTESFMALASHRFAETPIARKYGLVDLDWFLSQWIYETGMPSYRLEYDWQARPEGGVLLTGTVYQDGVPDNWLMPLPVVIEFGSGNGAKGTIYARGPQTPVRIGLPAPPKRVLLDPDLWVLSDKPSESRLKH